MHEFDLIDRYFKPLARGFSGSFDLSDDAAVISAPTGCDLVATKDAISAGVHFIGDENPALIAKKLLRVNLSDLAAMGAQPLCYMLALILPKETGEAWVADFAKGLAEDQAQFGLHLIGGDTISTQGALSLSLTAFGTVPAGKALRRSGARAGDAIYVSGTLGDSALGLLCHPREPLGRSGDLQPPWHQVPASAMPREDDVLFLKQRYQLPDPRVALGQALRNVASSCMDISDGLMQDVGHICAASQVGAVIMQGRLPLSPAAAAATSQDASLWDVITGGGDDYELLFTVPEKNIPQVESLSAALSLRLTCIGRITEKKGVELHDAAGAALPIPKGFQHF